MSSDCSSGRSIAGTSRALEPAQERRGRHATNIVGVPWKQRDRPVEAIDFTVFAAMPFSPSFDDVFFLGIKPAAESVGGRAVRVDQIVHGGDAVAETLKQIQACKLVVGDVSTSEPDVLYELGYAYALAKPCVQICSTSYGDLPFMIRNRETVLYLPGRIHLLTQQLSLYLASFLEQT